MTFREQMQNTQRHQAAPSRPDQTRALTRGVIRMLIDLGLSPLAEFELANGRRTDIAAFDRQGRLTIVEVKSCRADFDADQKWPDYLEFCDRFYFAVDLGFPTDILPSQEGLIIADGFGATIKRAASTRSLAPQRGDLTFRPSGGKAFFCESVGRKSGNRFFAITARPVWNL